MAKRTASPRYSLYGLVVFTMLLGLATILLVSQRGRSQENRGQAAACSEAPVDVQFRMYTGQDTPWIPGSAMAPKAGDAIDVNCFAKNGSALLSQGKITVTVTPAAGGSAKTLTVPSASNKGSYLTNYRLPEAGTYRFTCANPTNSCSNTDQLVATADVSLPARPTVQVSCQDAKPIATISWPTSSTVVAVNIDNDTNWNNGLWSKPITNGNSTQAPAGFVPQNRTGTLQLQPNTAYRVRLTNAAGASAIANFTPTTCSTTGDTDTTTNAISDLNKNGQADPDDYRLFIEDYRERLDL